MNLFTVPYDPGKREELLKKILTQTNKTLENGYITHREVMFCTRPMSCCIHIHTTHLGSARIFAELVGLNQKQVEQTASGIHSLTK